MVSSFPIPSALTQLFALAKQSPEAEPHTQAHAAMVARAQLLKQPLSPAHTRWVLKRLKDTPLPPFVFVALFDKIPNTYSSKAVRVWTAAALMHHYVSCSWKQMSVDKIKWATHTFEALHSLALPPSSLTQKTARLFQRLLSNVMQSTPVRAGTTNSFFASLHAWWPEILPAAVADAHKTFVNVLGGKWKSADTFTLRYALAQVYWAAPVMDPATKQQTATLFQKCLAQGVFSQELAQNYEVVAFVATTDATVLTEHIQSHARAALGSAKRKM